ncbi:DUF4232 domain-containing protein [Streptomyces sp. B1866]|uniref:DUF4232 domain-containing protein n=1 Tax=Streptomyces sp. B1866 TaxID=3075431 RepID=UPI00288EDDFA|nr:DUF4232 domain-containing protein [Streptomyces sp. B1866]MDT3399387.1 DUF4232 domain-containing protein [Streptomyces sp. B1866]
MAQHTRTTTTRRRSLAASALLVAAVAAAAACGTDSGDGARGAVETPGLSSGLASHTGPEGTGEGSSAASRSTPGASAPGSVAPSSAPGASTAPGASSAPSARRICAAGDLKLSFGRVDIGAGNIYAPLVFTNTGKSSCTLTGFPGVSVLDSSGKAIGAPATRSGAAHGTLTLKSGGSVHASVHTVNEGVSGKPCRPAASTIRAYPPDSRQALTAPVRSFRVCGGVFDVSAVEPGTRP